MPLSIRLLVVAILLSLSAKAQYVAISDMKMQAVLNHYFPTCMMNGSYLDTTCTKILTTTDFGCSSAKITSMEGIQYFKSLQILNCSSNDITYIPELPATLQHFYCSYNELTSLPQLPATLLSLNCTGNYGLTSLPTLPPALESLVCSKTGTFVNPPVLPQSLQHLECYECGIVQLPALPTSLQTLVCNNNDLTSLPALPLGLTRLHCNSNKIISLPALPDGLLTLDCRSNKLSVLPTLPGSLLSLECGNNTALVLPLSLPPVLTYLDCSLANLTSLPVLPTGLVELHCYQNKLASLPALPDSLKKLWCSDNKLTSLPALPKKLTELQAPGNLLTSLPELPDVLARFNVYNNPQLLCMPVLKKLTGSVFSIQQTGIKCLPNVIQHPNVPNIPAIDTMPVCDLLNNPNDCAIGWSIQGSIFNDANTNCTMQLGENKVTAPVKVNLYLNGNLEQSMINAGGAYSFKTGLATYVVEADNTNLPFDISCNNDTTVMVSAADSLLKDVHFGLKCKPGVDLAVRSIFGNLFRPATNTMVRITAGDLSVKYGMNCSNGTSGTVQVTITGPAQYAAPASGALIPSNVAGKVITWNVADFGAVHSDTAFNIVVHIDTTATANDMVCFNVKVSSPTTDIELTNNELTQCFGVRTSFDPNDKQADPAGRTDTSVKWLTYAIRFQNTGNDTAFNIYVMDTLSNSVDVSSFQLLSSSHKNITQVSGSGIVKFNFPNILLPDSNVNELLSHGYVQYKVKLKENLLVGTEIKNTAYIYFDYNAPVVTNTTTNTITTEVLTGVGRVTNNELIQLFPNPANSMLTVVAGSPLQLLEVYDITGRKLWEWQATASVQRLQIPLLGFAEGLYLLKVNGNTSQRFIIAK